MAGSQDLDQLRKLEALAEDKEFKTEWSRIKRLNKIDLSEAIRNRTGIVVDPDSLFDIQVKRFHEYKRQHLNVLHILTLYNRIKQNPDVDIVPRTFIFGGKAAPGYFMAKLIIRLINAVAEVVNQRSGRTRSHQGGVFPQFQRKKFAIDLSRCGSLRTDLYGRQGGFRNREHEILDEWSTHDWHSGRRQCGNQRRSRT